MTASSSIKERAPLFFIAAVLFLTNLEFVIMIPLAPIVIRTAGISLSDFTNFIAIYTIIATIAGLIGGFVIDKWSRNLIFPIALLGFAASAVLCSLAKNFLWFEVAKCSCGFFQSILTVFCLAAVSDLVPFSRRGRAHSLVHSSSGIAAAVGVPAGLWFSQYWGWQSIFTVFGIAALLILPFLMQQLKRIPEAKWDRGSQQAVPGAELAGTNHSLSRSLLAFISFYVLFLMLSQYMITPLIPQAVVFNGGFSESYLQLLYSIGGFVHFLLVPVIGRLADQTGKVSMIKMLTAASIIPIGMIAFIPKNDYIHAGFAVASSFLIFGSRMPIVISLLSELGGEGARGRFMGYITTIRHLSASFAIWLSGSIAMVDSGSNHIGNMLHVASVAVIAAAIFYWLTGAIFSIQTVQLANLTVSKAGVLEEQS